MKVSIIVGIVATADGVSAESILALTAAAGAGPFDGTVTTMVVDPPTTTKLHSAITVAGDQAVREFIKHHLDKVSRPEPTPDVTTASTPVREQPEGRGR